MPRLLGVPMYTSARTLFVNKPQDNGDFLIRKQCYTLNLGLKALITELLNLYLIFARSGRLIFLLTCVTIFK